MISSGNCEIGNFLSNTWTRNNCFWKVWVRLVHGKHIAMRDDARIAVTVLPACLAAASIEPVLSAVFHGQHAGGGSGTNVPAVPLV